MTIRHLKIFNTVCQDLSMTSAAKKLFMTQPSVSQAIKEMETYYDCKLFERLSNKLFITKKGEEVLKLSVHIIEMFDELDNLMMSEIKDSSITIGANYTVGSCLVHNYIKNYSKLYPDSGIKMYVNKSKVLKTMLRENKIDIALVEESAKEKDFVYKEFCDDKIMLVVCKEHRLAKKELVTLDDISVEHLLLRETGAGVRDAFERKMKTHGIEIIPYWESTSTTALINGAKNNFGVAVIPFELVKDVLFTGELVEIKIKDVDLSRKLVIMHHKNKFISKELKDFMDICINMNK